MYQYSNILANEVIQLTHVSPEPDTSNIAHND